MYVCMYVYIYVYIYIGYYGTLGQPSGSRHAVAHVHSEDVYNVHQLFRIQYTCF